MLETDIIICELSDFLATSNLIIETAENHDETNTLILVNWQERIERAIYNDFSKCLHLKIICYDSNFELISNTGSPKWSMRIRIIDEKINPNISIWFVSYIKSCNTELWIADTAIRQCIYNGNNSSTSTFLQKIKLLINKGYASSVKLSDLLKFDDGG